METKDRLVAIIFGVCLGLLVACFAGPFIDGMGYARGVNQIRLEATEAGVAQFVADPKTGVTEFKWKEQTK